MTPDEIICTTCNDRGWITTSAGRFVKYAAIEGRHGMWEIVNRWKEYAGVDACLECGRGGEVGRL